MDEDKLLDQIPSIPASPDALTEQERAFIVQVLDSGVNFQGTYTQLVPTMNIVQSIIRKLSNNGSEQ